MYGLSYLNALVHLSKAGWALRTHTNGKQMVRVPVQTLRHGCRVDRTLEAPFSIREPDSWNANKFIDQSTRPRPVEITFEGCSTEVAVSAKKLGNRFHGTANDRTQMGTPMTPDGTP